MERVLGSASNPAGVGYRCGAAVGLVTALYGEGRRAWEAEAQLLLSAGLEALPGVLGMGECLLWHNSSCCVRWERELPRFGGSLGYFAGAGCAAGLYSTL